MQHEVRITAVAHGGHGVARIDGQVCFVPYGLPGDTLRIALERETKSVLWGRIVEVLEPSPHRVVPPCGVYPECGSCMWIHFGYPAQAAWKSQIVRDCFTRIGKMAVEPTLRDVPELRLGYRTRAEFHVQDGRIGYFKLGTNDVVDVEHCPLSHPRLNDALARLRTAKPRQPVEITVNPEEDDVLVWTRQPDPEVGRVFPRAQHLKSREPRDWFSMDGVPVVNGCFSQSSLLLNRLLREIVHSQVGEPRNVLDLYCGSGNFSIALPESVDVTGIDHNRAAIFAADTQRPGAYHAGDTRAMVDAVGRRPWDAIILDPPRAGAKELMRALGSARARRIVYVSCDPATLARDCRALAEHGWHVEQLDVIDMFPHTPHVECVARLERS